MTREDVERDNTPENHRAGVTAEYAVTRWLKDNRKPIQCNFEDIVADFGGAADIVSLTTGIRCDVKSSGEHRFPENQRSSLVTNKDIVIWCWSREDGLFSAEGRRIQTYLVEIYGWSLASSIKPLPAANGWIAVPTKDVSRDLGALLAQL